MAKRGLWTLVWAAITSVVAILYLLPNAGPPETYRIDKLCHLAAFAAIGFPLRFLARTRHGYRTSIGFGFMLGVVLELIQSGAPGRVFSLADMAVNGIGLCIGLIAAASVANALSLPAAGPGA